MDPTEITLLDVQNLEDEYKKAKASVGDCGEVNGYPIHPQEISQFMISLAGSKWGDTSYDPSNTKSLIDRLDSATLVDCKRILTFCSRGERFAVGHWLTILKSDLIEKVIRRIEVLVGESPDA